jgi:hypothetical protein
MTARRMIAPLAALTALASSQAAQAQQPPCVNTADLSDAVTYAMPIAFDAVRTTCANRLDRRGFVATRGEAYVAQFRARQNAAWPGALRMLRVFMAGQDEGGTDVGALIAGMPAETVRPFVDGLIGQLLTEEIKPQDCAKIERGLELVSPMPAENVGPLIGFIVELSDVKDPAICPAGASAAPKR